MRTRQQRTRPQRTGLAAALAAVAATALGTAAFTTPAQAATAVTIDPVAYGQSVIMTPGTNADSQLPIGVDLPAAGDGVTVTRLVFSWPQPSPTLVGTNSASTGSYTVAADCQPNTACHVDATVPTARMSNGTPTVNLDVYADDTLLGQTSHQLRVNNPKPTVTFTSPGYVSTAWGLTTFTADATPSSGGVPVTGVRFYLDPTGADADAYTLDTTAPYTFTTDSADIAGVGGTGMVVAVAQDAQGNLSPTDAYDPKLGLDPHIRRVTVGPPPQVAWELPDAEGAPDGDMASAAQLEWTAAIPATYPDDPADPSANPYITDVKEYIDGQLLLDMPWTTGAGWQSYRPNAKLRSAGFIHPWDATNPIVPMTPGPHTARVVVTTNYGAVGEDTRRFIVGNGIGFTAVTSRGHQVDDGYLMTAGDRIPLTTTAAANVLGGSDIYRWSVTANDGGLLTGDCSYTGVGSCGDTTFTAWFTESTPGRYKVTWQAEAAGVDEAATMTRTIVVQPAGVLSAHAPTSRIHAGHRITLSGRLTRADTGRGVANMRVALQWHKAGTSTWATVAHRTSSSTGGVAARVRPRATGTYRWRTAGVPGKLSAATSQAVRVTVTR